MILQSITLKNFRQFRDEHIDFANGDDNKNVTIIIGENGTGKTTFAQAFLWCMYGTTSFSDKIILNKIALTKMSPDRAEEVEVSLCLRHGEIEYLLKRTQLYHKDYSDHVTGENAILEIQKKDVTGNISWVKKTMIENEVNTILPKELSKFFFFDGERIEKMSKDIAAGKKSTEFMDAVQGILGLKGMKSAIDHFNPAKKNCVIGSYDSSFDSNSNDRIKEYQQTIDKCKEEDEKINERLEGLKEQISLAELRMHDKQEEIKQYDEGEKAQKKKEDLTKHIDAAKEMKNTFYNKICGEFNKNSSSFFSVSLINKALEIINKNNYNGIDIPHMEGDTIEYLLKRKLCICGTHLDEGSVPYGEVKKLIDVLPPKMLSTTIALFKKQARSRITNNSDLLEMAKQDMSSLSKLDDEIDNLNDEIDGIDKLLNGNDVRDKVKQINSEIHICDSNIKKFSAEKDDLLRQQGANEKELESTSQKRNQLALLDNNNKKIALYLAYAKRIYEEIKSEYVKNEEQIREKLENTINNIFKQIYNGDMSLTIDSQYYISVYVNNYSGYIETSTAQSIAVIFAFITGIIQLARENRNSKDENAKLLSSEPYPLVMDAPLSTFDKKRIKTVCEALPKTADQVIIFIKDTDGALAEEYLGVHIGSRHQFEKLNEFETKLI